MENLLTFLAAHAVAEFDKYFQRKHSDIYKPALAWDVSYMTRPSNKVLFFSCYTHKRTE